MSVCQVSSHDLFAVDILPHGTQFSCYRLLFIILWDLVNISTRSFASVHDKVLHLYCDVLFRFCSKVALAL